MSTYLREGVGDGVHSDLGHEQADEADVLFGHVVVQQHADGHDGGRARRHRRVHQDHAVVLYVFREAEVVQLGKKKTVIIVLEG